MQDGPASPNHFPRVRPVAAHAILFEFGDTIDDLVHQKVIALDAALTAEPFVGFRESVPAYASVLIAFDPAETDHALVEAHARRIASTNRSGAGTGQTRNVDVCYDGDLAPDLGHVARAAGLSIDEVIRAHSSATYRVYMYGFAPGYAYLAGVPEALRLPRKPAARRDVPAGSVLIAGAQCLVSTLLMPTGWWNIGRSPTRILDSGSMQRPFLFNAGDVVRFRQMTRDQFDKANVHE